MPHPGEQFADGGAAGQERFILREGERAQQNAKLVLPVPHVGTGHRATAEQRAIAAQASAFAVGKAQPVTDKFLDANRHAEITGEQRDQSVLVVCLTRQVAGEVELSKIGDRIAIAKPRGRQSKRRTDIRGEAIIFRPIQVDRRLRLRPSAIEQGQKAMMEYIEEARQGPIRPVQHALPSIFGKVQGQWSVRTEQAEEAHHHTRRTPFLRQFKGRERRRCEGKRRFLTQANRLLGGSQSRPQPRLAWVQALDAAQRLEEVEAVRLLFEFAEQIYRIGRSPHRGTQRITSPRAVERSTVSVNELMET